MQTEVWIQREPAGESPEGGTRSLPGCLLAQPSGTREKGFPRRLPGLGFQKATRLGAACLVASAPHAAGAVAGAGGRGRVHRAARRTGSPLDARAAAQLCRWAGRVLGGRSCGRAEQHGGRPGSAGGGRVPSPRRWRFGVQVSASRPRTDAQGRTEFVGRRRGAPGGSGEAWETDFVYCSPRRWLPSAVAGARGGRRPLDAGWRATCAPLEVGGRRGRGPSAPLPGADSLQATTGSSGPCRAPSLPGKNRTKRKKTLLIAPPNAREAPALLSDRLPPPSQDPRMQELPSNLGVPSPGGCLPETVSSSEEGGRELCWKVAVCGSPSWEVLVSREPPPHSRPGPCGDPIQNQDFFFVGAGRPPL